MHIDYELLDSGDGKKLERFGDRILIRPSSWALWTPRLSEVWRQADAEFFPKEGWHFSQKQFSEWPITISMGLHLRLELQQNGQIGIFPEHSQYLPQVLSHGGERILSLFAYTGLATTIAAHAGRSVHHVELSTRVIEWAKGNLSRNTIPAERVKFIQDDAITYLERLKKRGEKFDCIIADPPSFSRISAKKTWTLGEEVQRILGLLEEVRGPSGRIFFTAHEGDIGPCSVRNLVLDRGIREAEVTRSELVLREQSGRELPAGFLVTWG